MTDDHPSGPTCTEAAAQHTPFALWNLPDTILFEIVSFLAPPTNRAGSLCHKIAPLCKSSYEVILNDAHNHNLWDMVLASDYGVVLSQREKRRKCKRLRRSPVDQVRDAHKLLRDNTEIAYFYLSELGSTQTQQGLTRSRFCGILNEYGPNLILNRPVASGGTFLVEVCRARNTSQNMILQCVQELVERRGALVNISSFESKNAKLTPLCVASARGLANVVEYLLGKGASKDSTSSARFRLHKNSKKSVRCTDQAPAAFANTMLEAEQQEGATNRELVGLRKCISLLGDT